MSNADAEKVRKSLLCMVSVDLQWNREINREEKKEKLQELCCIIHEDFAKPRERQNC